MHCLRMSDSSMVPVMEPHVDLVKVLTLASSEMLIFLENIKHMSAPCCWLFQFGLAEAMTLNQAPAEYKAVMGTPRCLNAVSGAS